MSSFAVFSQAPTAQFNAPVLSACAGVPLNFVNQSTAGGSPISGYSWDFGDGNSATTENASHAYTNAGVYTVTLVASATNGQADAEVKSQYITIFPNPTATFTISGNGCTVPFGVTFTNTSSTGPGMTYAWSFGNGQTSSAQNPPMVTYATAGTFQVKLTVRNTTTGCVSEIIKPIVVSNFAAGITAPAHACVGTAVTLMDNSTAGVDKWTWNLGNGQTSLLQNPTAIYQNPGTYTITLTSRNTVSGCQSTVTKQIIVHPKPLPSFTASSLTGCTPASIGFTNTSTPPGGTFEWDYGDGGTATGPNPPPHIYTVYGMYTVTLTMTDANGCSSTKTVADMIQIYPVIANFAANVTEGCDPLTVQFSESSVSPNPTQNPIVSWLWTFGDGTTYNGQTPPPHVYPLGVYDVSLKVTTQSGCTETNTWNDSIRVGHIDHVDFSSFPLSACAKTDVNFTNLTVIGVPHDPADVKYEWNFYDGPPSSAENPTHQYNSDTGFFDVMLIVDYRGCKDTLKKTDVVYIIAPISTFSPDQSLFCNPETFPINVHLNDNSKYGLASDDVYMTWNFGDGTNAIYNDADVAGPTKGSVSHTYNNYGTYTVKQVIRNYTTGCVDSSFRLIHISKIDASFTLSNDSVCKGGSISAFSSSTSSHPINSWMYNSPGAEYQYLFSTPNVTYTYLSPGNYDISVIVNNVVGCEARDTVHVKALEYPVAAFTADDLFGCAPFPVTFTNQSHAQGNGAPVGTFVWTFIDDNTAVSTLSLNDDVTHTFITEDTFNIRLTVTDRFGCVTESDTMQIVTTKPAAQFTVDSVVCDLEIFHTQNGSTGSAPMTYQWFSDGISSSPIGTSASLEHAYDENPSNNYTHLPHSIWLIATDNHGCKDTTMQNLLVSLPVAGIDYNLSGANVNEDGSFNCPPVFATFTDQTESYGDIASWNWVFGDGKSSILQNPSNTYVFSGIYTASLTVTDEFGCTSDTVLFEYLAIGGPSAEPSWSLSPGVSCSQNIVFNLNNPQDVYGVTWNTGDGQTVEDSLHFVHVYPPNTAFGASVMIVDSLGCEVLYELPLINIPITGLEALFTSNTHEISLQGKFIFYDQSVSDSPIVSWQWDFGDGNIVTNTTGESVTHTYPTIGPRTIILTITDQNGCKSQYEMVVNVIGEFDIPNVFTPNGNGVNENFTLMHDMFRYYDIIIVNRWGDVVEKKLKHTGVLLWDGRNQGGEECVDGVYFYRLEGTLFDGTTLEKAGFVTLIRTE